MLSFKIFLFTLSLSLLSFSSQAQFNNSEPILHGEKIYFHIIDQGAASDMRLVENRFTDMDKKFLNPEYNYTTHVFSLYIGKDGRVIDVNEILKKEFNIVAKQIDNPDPSLNSKEYNLYGDSK